MMKFLIKTLCCSLLVLGINISAYSSTTINTIQQNNINNIQTNNINNTEENLYKDKIKDFIDKSPAERNNIIKNNKINIINKLSKYNEILFKANDKISQLDYDEDTQWLINDILNECDKPQTILELGTDNLDILNKNINNKDSIKFSNEMKFADFLFAFRDKLNNLYKSKSKDNIKSVLEEYIKYLTVLHNIIQNSNVYNNYEIDTGYNSKYFFNLNVGDFDSLLLVDKEQKEQYYYKINRKMSRIQNTCYILQNYLNNNLKDLNDADIYNDKRYVAGAIIINNSLDNIHGTYDNLLHIIMQAHNLIIRSINEILYLHCKDEPMRANHIIDGTGLYEQYLKFFKLMNKKTTYRNDKQIESVSDFILCKYIKIHDFYYYNKDKFTNYYRYNTYFDDIIALCNLYKSDEDIQNDIKKLKELNNKSKYSVIRDPKNDGYGKIGSILHNMSKKLSEVQ